MAPHTAFGMHVLGGGIVALARGALTSPQKVPGSSEAQDRVYLGEE